MNAKNIKQRIISLLVLLIMILSYAAVMSAVFLAQTSIAASAATSIVTSNTKAPVVGSVSTGRNTIIINFKSQNVNGYRLWIADNKSFKNKNIYDSSNPKFTLSGLKANTKYYIKATTYVRKNGVKVYSSSNNVSYTTRVAPTPTVSSLKSTYFTVSTTLQKANVTGYRIYIADNKNFENSILLQNSTGSFSQKNLKQNTTYYVKAYTYITKSGKVYWSNATVKTIKTLAVPTAEVKSKSANSNCINLTFKSKNVDGYRFWISTNKDYSNKLIRDSSYPSFNINPYMINDNVKNTTYYVKACGYVIRGGKKYYSDSNNFTMKMGSMISNDGVEEKYINTVNNSKYMMHALGGVDGKYMYVDSVDALKLAYNSGNRLFEVDVNLTSDGVPVLVHGWTKSDYINRIGSQYYKANAANSSGQYIPTHDEFMKFNIQGHFRASDFSDLIEFMDKHDDMYVLVDVWNRNYTNTLTIYNAIVDSAGGNDSALEHLIVGGHTTDMIKAVKEVYNFKIYNLYFAEEKSRDKALYTPKQMIDYCKANKIQGFSVDANVFTDDIAKQFKNSGLIIYVFTVNDEAKANHFLDVGASIVGTDFLR